MEDRIFSGNDIVSGAGTKTVSFTNPFKTVNYAVGITMENARQQETFLQFLIKQLILLMFYLKIQVVQIYQEHLILLQKDFKRSIKRLWLNTITT
jgi:hypothetical protein